MENVWEELKKIEAKAQKITIEAQNKAKEITRLSQQEAEKLVSNSKIYAQEKAQDIYKNTIEEANRSRTQQLKENEAAVERLKVQAEKRMEQASVQVVDSVLGETKP